jgi:hypothetical protein
LVETFQVRYGSRWAHALLCVLMLTAVALWPGALGRAVGVAIFVMTLAAPRLLASQVLVDEQGYRLRARGRERARVAWSDVRRVKLDRAEHAAYVDTGDPARNLLVPPGRGWAFHIERAEILVARISAAVPGRLREVERLDAPWPEEA